MSDAFVAGLISGTFSQVVCHPLDTLKTLAQTGRPIVLSNIFNGVTPMIAKSLIRSPLTPFLNHMIRSQLGKEPLPLRDVIFAGSMTGVLQSPLSHGFDFFKIHQQNGNTNTVQKLKSQPYAIARGFWCTAARNLLGCAAYYYSYEGILRWFKPNSTFGHAAELGNVKVFLSGGLAGCFTWVVQIPLDTVKTQMQLQCFEEATYASLLQQSSVRSLYRGLFPICVRSFAYNGLNMVLFEKLCAWLRQQRELRTKWDSEHYHRELRDFIHCSYVLWA